MEKPKIIDQFVAEQLNKTSEMTLSKTHYLFKKFAHPNYQLITKRELSIWLDGYTGTVEIKVLNSKVMVSISRDLCARERLIMDTCEDFADWCDLTGGRLVMERLKLKQWEQLYRDYANILPMSKMSFKKWLLLGQSYITCKEYDSRAQLVRLTSEKFADWCDIQADTLLFDKRSLKDWVQIYSTFSQELPLSRSRLKQWLVLGKKYISNKIDK